MASIHNSATYATLVTGQYFCKEVAYVFAAHLKYVNDKNCGGIDWGKIVVPDTKSYQDLVHGITNGKSCFRQENKVNIGFLEMLAIHAIYERLSMRGNLKKLFDDLTTASSFAYDDALRASISSSGSLDKVKALHPALAGTTIDDMVWATKAIVIMLVPRYLTKPFTKISVFEFVSLLMQLDGTVLPVIKEILQAINPPPKAENKSTSETATPKKGGKRSTKAAAVPIATVSVEQQDDEYNDDV